MEAKVSSAAMGGIVVVRDSGLCKLKNELVCRSDLTRQ